MRHIQFCLDEIECEIEAAATASLLECERLALCDLVSSMRTTLSGVAARRAALALAMPAVSPAAIDGSAEASAVEAPVSVSEPTAAAEARTEPSLALVETLPPPVAPVPAPIRIVSAAKPTVVVAAAIEPAVVVTAAAEPIVVEPIIVVPTVVEPIAVEPAVVVTVMAEPIVVEPAVAVAPTPPSAKVIALPKLVKRRSSVALTRIAASLLIVIGLGTGVVLQQFQNTDPLVGSMRATLAQSLVDSHAKLLDVIEAGRKLMSLVPDLRSPKAES